MTVPAPGQSPDGPLQAGDLIVYLRRPEAALDMAALNQIVALTNGLLTEVAGPVTAPPARVLSVLLEVAARAYRNPEGVTEKHTGPFWKTVAVASRLGVYLTDSEVQQIAGPPTLTQIPTWSGSLPVPPMTATAGFLAGDPISVTVVSTVTTTTDDGDSTTVTTETLYDECMFAPRASSERTDSRSPAVITGATLYREGELPVDADDDIRIEDVAPQVDGVWQVEGAPGYWADAGVEIAITRTGDL